LDEERALRQRMEEELQVMRQSRAGHRLLFVLPPPTMWRDGSTECCMSSHGYVTCSFQCAKLFLPSVRCCVKVSALFIQSACVPLDLYHQAFPHGEDAACRVGGVSPHIASGRLSNENLAAYFVCSPRTYASFFSGPDTYDTKPKRDLSHQ